MCHDYPGLSNDIFLSSWIRNLPENGLITICASEDVTVAGTTEVSFKQGLRNKF